MQLLGQQFPLAHIPLYAFTSTPPPSVLWELHGEIDFNGKCLRSSSESEFSEGSFMVIIYENYCDLTTFMEFHA